MILDDAQWADELSLRLLTAWARGVAPDRRTLVIVAFREEEVEDDHALRAIAAREHLRLPPLAAAEVASLATTMAGTLPPEALDAVERLSDGNPFMATAVLRGLVESAALRRERDGWRVSRAALADVSSSQAAADVLLARVRHAPGRDARAAHRRRRAREGLRDRPRGGAGGAGPGRRDPVAGRGPAAQHRVDRPGRVPGHVRPRQAARGAPRARRAGGAAGAAPGGGAADRGGPTRTGRSSWRTTSTPAASRTGRCPTRCGRRRSPAAATPWRPPSALPHRARRGGAPRRGGAAGPGERPRRRADDGRRLRGGAGPPGAGAGAVGGRARPGGGRRPPGRAVLQARRRRVGDRGVRARAAAARPAGAARDGGLHPPGAPRGRGAGGALAGARGPGGPARAGPGREPRDARGASLQPPRLPVLVRARRRPDAVVPPARHEPGGALPADARAGAGLLRARAGDDGAAVVRAGPRLRRPQPGDPPRPGRRVGPGAVAALPGRRPVRGVALPRVHRELRGGGGAAGADGRPLGDEHGGVARGDLRVPPGQPAVRRRAGTRGAPGGARDRRRAGGGHHARHLVEGVGRRRSRPTWWPTELARGGGDVHTQAELVQADALRLMAAGRHGRRRRDAAHVPADGGAAGVPPGVRGATRPVAGHGAAAAAGGRRRR